MARQSSTSRIKVQAAMRRVVALRLRRDGNGYAQIADELGVTPGAACKMVKKELAAINAGCAELAEEIRQIELERLDLLWRKALEDVNKDERLPSAIPNALKIMERRTRFLGLDAPVKTESAVDVFATARAEDLTDDQLAAIIAAGTAPEVDSTPG